MSQTINKRFIKGIKSFLNRMPYVRTLHKLNSNSKFPAGHYYSSVVSLAEMKSRECEIWPDYLTKEIQGIDLNETEQLTLFKELSIKFEGLNIPEKKVEGRRYYAENSYFSHGDSHILGAIIKHYRPKKIIEIGSGFSSALMLDLNEFSLNGEIHLTFIEPFPEDRLNSFLPEVPNSKIVTIQRKVQDVQLGEFEKLSKGDILFIDSTHVVKTGSDVNYIMFQILPILKSGVLIHFHDIYYPFEYPKSWVLNGYGWNESYFLRSFLMYNNKFKVLLFSDFIVKFHQDQIKHLPLFLKSPGSALWLEKH